MNRNRPRTRRRHPELGLTPPPHPGRALQGRRVRSPQPLPRPSRLPHLTPHPLASRVSPGDTSWVSSKGTETASSSAGSHPRPTRAEVLGAVQAEFPGEHVGRNHPGVRHRYTSELLRWRFNRAMDGPAGDPLEVA